MSIRTIKVNGKGRQPQSGTLAIDGRNSFGARHVDFIFTTEDKKSTFCLCNINIQDMTEFMAQLNEAFKKAQTADDTTPEKYKKPAPAAATSQQVPPPPSAPVTHVDPAGNVYTLINNQWVLTTPAPTPSTPPVVNAPATSTAVDLPGLQELSSAVATPAKPKTKRGGKKS